MKTDFEVRDHLQGADEPINESICFSSYQQFKCNFSFIPIYEKYLLAQINFQLSFGMKEKCDFWREHR